MAGAGYRNWTAGDIPTADQFDTFLQEQVVGVYDDTADRDTQLSVAKAEGMYAYARDINTLHFYNGAAWEIVHEPIQSWNVTSITQLGSVACTTTRGWYQRSHGVWRAQLVLTISGTGTIGNAVVVPTPFTLPSVHDIGGPWTFQDANTSNTYNGSIHPLTTTTFQLAAIGTLGVSPAVAITSPDVLRLTAQGTY